MLFTRSRETLRGIAHNILDAARDGEPISEARIRWALRILGDIPQGQ